MPISAGCTRLEPRCRRDDKRAAELFRRACDANEPTGCNNLGVLYQRGTGVTKDLTLAATMFAKACARNDSSSCAELSVAYRDGLGVKTDVVKSFELARRACEGGPRGCVTLGVAYEDGVGTARDLALALVAYQRGCTGADPLSCNDLAAMIAAGKGVDQDLPRAVALYQQACDGGDPLGCTNLGGKYAFGLGVAKDPERGCSALPQGLRGWRREGVRAGRLAEVARRTAGARTAAAIVAITVHWIISRPPPPHVCTEALSAELRLRSPYQGVVTGRPILRLRVMIAPRSLPAREILIDVDDLAVEVRAVDGGFVLGAGAIDALFVVERQPRCGFLTWFGVFARRRGRADRLLLETPDGPVARFVERAIEERLGLADEPVRGELHVAL